MGLGALLKAVKDDFTENVNEFLNTTNRVLYGEDFYKDESRPTLYLVPTQENPPAETFCNRDDPYKVEDEQATVTRSDQSPRIRRQPRERKSRIEKYLDDQGKPYKNIEGTKLYQTADKIYAFEGNQIVNMPTNLWADKTMDLIQQQNPQIRTEGRNVILNDNRRIPYEQFLGLDMNIQPRYEDNDLSPRYVDSNQQLNIREPTLDDRVDRESATRLNPRLQREQVIQFKNQLQKRLDVLGTPASTQEIVERNEIEQVLTQLDQMEYQLSEPSIKSTLPKPQTAGPKLTEYPVGYDGENQLGKSTVLSRATPEDDTSELQARNFQIAQQNGIKADLDEIHPKRLARKEQLDDRYATLKVDNLMDKIDIANRNLLDK